jgi:membrane-associated PAP2 superfamily phosphatase
MGALPNPMYALPRTDSSRSLALWTLAALLLVAGWDASGLDLPAARLLAGPHGFPLQEHWLLTKVLHAGVLPLSWVLVGWITLGVRWPTFGLQRLAAGLRLRWAGGMWLSLLVVDLMKRGSRTSCPWDLAEFGGTAVHVSHWAWGVFDGGVGHCFPAGHAIAGFVFVAGFFAWRRQSPAQARRWLAGGLIAGSVLGLSQQLRGAHYMSHTLWTAWLCWVLAWAVHAVPALSSARRPVASTKL